MSLIFERYMNLEKQANVLFKENKLNECQQLAKQQKSIRNEEFTKFDWQELIAQSSGRAKFEYTKIMKKKFPD